MGDVGKSGQECWTCRLWLMYAYVSADVSYYNLLDLWPGICVFVWPGQTVNSPNWTGDTIHMNSLEDLFHLSDVEDGMSSFAGAQPQCLQVLGGSIYPPVERLRGLCLLASWVCFGYTATPPITSIKSANNNNNRIEKTNQRVSSQHKHSSCATFRMFHSRALGECGEYNTSCSAWCFWDPCYVVFDIVKRIVTIVLVDQFIDHVLTFYRNPQVL